LENRQETFKISSRSGYFCPAERLIGKETAAMEKQVQNIQDVYLNNVRKDKAITTIYLISGVKLTGRIKSFDKYSVILESNNQEQLVFKHAISTVTAGRSQSASAPTSSAIDT
jgi:host factor-I protein